MVRYNVKNFDFYKGLVRKFLDKKLARGLLTQETMDEVLKDLNQMAEECTKKCNEMEDHNLFVLEPAREKEFEEKWQKKQKSLEDRIKDECSVYPSSCEKHDEERKELKQKRRKAAMDRMSEYTRILHEVAEEIDKMRMKMGKDFEERHVILHDYAKQFEMV